MRRAIRRLQTVVIYVTDVERSRNFYGNVLGLDEVYASQGRIGFQLGDLRLLIHASEIAEGSNPRHSRIEVYLEVDDVDEVVKRLAERAVPILQEPADQVWGERDAAILDPDGYPIFLTQSLSNSWMNPEAEQYEKVIVPHRPDDLSNRVPRISAHFSVGGLVEVIGDDAVPVAEIRSDHDNQSHVSDGFTIYGGSETAVLVVNPDAHLRLEINSGSVEIRNIRGAIDAKVNTGDFTVGGTFSRGHSRIDCNAGDIQLHLQAGSDIRLKVPPHMRWQVQTEIPAVDRGEWVLGAGQALMEVAGNFGELVVEAD